MKKTYRKKAHPTHSGGYQGWKETDKADTLNVYDNTEMRTPILIVQDEKTDDADGKKIL